jgi:hypothetical protein
VFREKCYSYCRDVLRSAGLRGQVAILSTGVAAGAVGAVIASEIIEMTVL